MSQAKRGRDRLNVTEQYILLLDATYNQAGHPVHFLDTSLPYNMVSVVLNRLLNWCSTCLTQEKHTVLLRKRAWSKLWTVGMVGYGCPTRMVGDQHKGHHWPSVQTLTTHGAAWMIHIRFHHQTSMQLRRWKTPLHRGPYGKYHSDAGPLPTLKWQWVMQIVF